MNDLISTAVKAVKQCGYEPNIKGNEVYFFAPDRGYVYSIENKDVKYRINRFDMNIMPPFNTQKNVVMCIDKITADNIDVAVRSVPTLSLAQLKKAKFKAIDTIDDGKLLDVYNCVRKIDKNAQILSHEHEISIEFELHNTAFVLTFLSPFDKKYIIFGRYFVNGEDVALLPDDIFENKEIPTWLPEWFREYCSAFDKYRKIMLY